MYSRSPVATAYFIDIRNSFHIRTKDLAFLLLRFLLLPHLLLLICQSVPYNFFFTFVGKSYLHTCRQNRKCSDYGRCMYFLDRLDPLLRLLLFLRGNFWSDLSGHFKFSCFCTFSAGTSSQVTGAEPFVPSAYSIAACKLWRGRFYIYQCCYIVYRCGFDIFDCYCSAFKRAFHAFCRSGYFESTLPWFTFRLSRFHPVTWCSSTAPLLYCTFYGFGRTESARNAFCPSLRMRPEASVYPFRHPEVRFWNLR